VLLTASLILQRCSCLVCLVFSDRFSLRPQLLTSDAQMKIFEQRHILPSMLRLATFQTGGTRILKSCRCCSCILRQRLLGLHHCWSLKILPVKLKSYCRLLGLFAPIFGYVRLLKRHCFYLPSDKLVQEHKDDKLHGPRVVREA
jgi:hypothetical protein